MRFSVVKMYKLFFPRVSFQSAKFMPLKSLRGKLEGPVFIKGDGSHSLEEF